MGVLYNKRELNERRKQLRTDMTGAEKILWQELKGKKMCGEKFRRQFSVNAYVIDFYCPRLKLAVEIDGATHSTEEEKEYDLIRQSEIEVTETEFLRFSNFQIYNDLQLVLDTIRRKVEELKAKRL